MNGGIPETYCYKWHGKLCAVLIKPVFKPSIKRNALIELTSGVRMVVPWRSLRRAT